MKTVTDIKNEIESINRFINENLRTLTGTQIMRKKNEIDKLKQIELYLSTNPNKTYLEGEKTRLETLIENREKARSKWSEPKDVHPKHFKRIYEKEVGLNDLQNKLKTITYILS